VEHLQTQSPRTSPKTAKRTNNTHKTRNAPKKRHPLQPKPRGTQRPSLLKVTETTRDTPKPKPTEAELQSKSKKQRKNNPQPAKAYFM
jgi:hypothetical protein